MPNAFVRFFVRRALPVFAGVLLSAPAARADLIKGADLSILKAAEDGGVEYRLGGMKRDAVELFKQNGFNYVRLRLFVEPNGKDGQVNSLEYTLEMAKRVKAAGMPLLLDFQYSDNWADQRLQEMPAAWKSLSRPQLLAKVHEYTLDVLRRFESQGCLPDMVAIGNELTNGLLWPAGGPMTSDDMWPALVEVMNAGISAVREVAPADRLRIMLHIDRGDSAAVAEWFYGHCQKAKVDYDVMGLSFYPTSTHSIDDLTQNLTALATKYNKEIIVVETSYRFSGEQGALPYPTTPDGQKQFLDKLFDVVTHLPNGRGAGLFYWEPAWIEGNKWNGPSWTEEWESRALFDAAGNALPALSAFWRPGNGEAYPRIPKPFEEPRTVASAATPTAIRKGNWLQRHEDLVKTVAAHPLSQLIFVGDSISDVWQFKPSFKEFFGQYDPIDLGISGDRTEHVLYRLQNGELQGLSPKVAVVLIGTNNTTVDSPEWIAGGVTAIVNQIHSKLPKTKVLLLAIFPRGEKASKFRLAVDQTNQLLAKLNLPGTTYLDVSPCFLDPAGEIPQDLMGDRLHPTLKGYEAWYNEMRPTLDDMMK